MCLFLKYRERPKLVSYCYVAMHLGIVIQIQVFCHDKSQAIYKVIGGYFYSHLDKYIILSSFFLPKTTKVSWDVPLLMHLCIHRVAHIFIFEVALNYCVDIMTAQAQSI